jgi:hypothetical protein
MAKPGAGLTIIAICLPFLGKSVRVTLRRLPAAPKRSEGGSSKKT